MAGEQHWSFNQSVERMADRAFEALGLDESVARAIEACDAVLQVRFPGRNQRGD